MPAKQSNTRICLITGKRLKPEPPPLTGERTTAGELPLTTDLVVDRLASMRRQWASMTPDQRTGAFAIKLRAQYKRFSLEHFYLTGDMPPAIYAEL